MWTTKTGTCLRGEPDAVMLDCTSRDAQSMGPLSVETRAGPDDVTMLFLLVETKRDFESKKRVGLAPFVVTAFKGFMVVAPTPAGECFQTPGVAPAIRDPGGFG